MIPAEIKKFAILNCCKRVRRLLANDYESLTELEFEEAVFNNIHLDDLQDVELLKEVLKENKKEIEELQKARAYSDVILDYLKDAIVDGDELDILDLQCEYIQHLEEMNEFLADEILQVNMKINKLLKCI